MPPENPLTVIFPPILPQVTDTLQFITAIVVVVVPLEKIGIKFGCGFGIFCPVLKTKISKGAPTDVQVNAFCDFFKRCKLVLLLIEIRLLFAATMVL